MIVYWYGIAYVTDFELTVLNAFNNLKNIKNTKYVTMF